MKKIHEILTESQKLRDSEINLSSRIIQYNEKEKVQKKKWLEYTNTACKLTDQIQANVSCVPEIRCSFRRYR